MLYNIISELLVIFGCQLYGCLIIGFGGGCCLFLLQNDVEDSGMLLIWLFMGYKIIGCMFILMLGVVVLNRIGK